MTTDKGFRRAHFILGLEGLAILRRWWLDPDATEARVNEMAGVLARMEEDEVLSVARDVPESSLLDGYARWSEPYDDLFNPVVVAEERAVKPMLDSVGGVVADIGCGTGRHTKYLKDRGVDVFGLDQSPEMLARARQTDSDLRLCQAELLSLPFPDAAFDGAVCALVLAHFDDLEPALAEIARVVRDRGSIVISDIHPFAVALGGHAAYSDSYETFGVIRNYFLSHSAYLRAFRALGLQVEACEEPVWTEHELQAMRFSEAPDVAEEAVAGLPIVLAWQLRVMTHPGRVSPLS